MNFEDFKIQNTLGKKLALAGEPDNYVMQDNSSPMIVPKSTDEVVVDKSGNKMIKTIVKPSGTATNTVNPNTGKIDTKLAIKPLDMSGEISQETAPVETYDKEMTKVTDTVKSEDYMETANKPSNTYATWLMALAPVVAGMAVNDVQSGLAGSQSVFNKYAEVIGKEKESQLALLKASLKGKKGAGKEPASLKLNETELFRNPQGEIVRLPIMAGYNAGYRRVAPDEFRLTKAGTNILPNPNILGTTLNANNEAVFAPKSELGANREVDPMFAQRERMSQARSQAIANQNKYKELEFNNKLTQQTLKDADYVEGKQKLSASEDILAIATSKNPVLEENYKGRLLRALGTVGNASDLEAGRAIDKSWTEKFNQALSFAQSGNLTPTTIANLVDVANIMSGIGKLRADTAIDKHTKSAKEGMNVDISKSVNPYKPENIVENTKTKVRLTDPIKRTFMEVDVPSYNMKEFMETAKKKGIKMEVVR